VVSTGFWWFNLRERDHWGCPDVNGSIILRLMEGRDVQRFLVGKSEGNDHWGDPDVDGRIILREMECKVVHKVLVGKREGKRPLGRHRRRWKDNIKMYGALLCAKGSGEET
jgi:hypothetical protein